jgi:hypothetical protein
MEKVKELLGIAKPGGLDDIAVRAAKTAAAAFAAYCLRKGIDAGGVTVYKGAIEAAYVAGASVILNAMLLLGPGEPGQKTGGDEEVDADAPPSE